MQAGVSIPSHHAQYKGFAWDGLCKVIFTLRQAVDSQWWSNQQDTDSDYLNNYVLYCLLAAAIARYTSENSRARALLLSTLSFIIYCRVILGGLLVIGAGILSGLTTMVFWGGMGLSSYIFSVCKGNTLSKPAQPTYVYRELNLYPETSYLNNNTPPSLQVLLNPSEEKALESVFSKPTPYVWQGGSSIAQATLIESLGSLQNQFTLCTWLSIEHLLSKKPQILEDLQSELHKNSQFNAYAATYVNVQRLMGTPIVQFSQYCGDICHKIRQDKTLCLSSPNLFEDEAKLYTHTQSAPKF